MTLYLIKWDDGSSVTVVQRFSSDLRLNLHFHALVLDGVYARDDKTGKLRFHRAPAISTAEVAGDPVEDLVERIALKAERWLAGQGFGVDDRATDRPRRPTTPTPTTRSPCFRLRLWRVALRSAPGPAAETDANRFSGGSRTRCRRDVARSMATTSTRASSLGHGTAPRWNG